MLNLKPYGNNDATTTKTVSVDFTDACYIHGSNRVQGLAFTNFENSYSDTSVRRISSDSIRNFLARCIDCDSANPERRLCASTIVAFYWQYSSSIPISWQWREFYKNSCHRVRGDSYHLYGIPARMPGSPSMARDLIILLRQNKISTKQSSRAGSVFVEIGGQVARRFQSTVSRDCS